MDTRTLYLWKIILLIMLGFFVTGDLTAQTTGTIPRSKPGQPTDSTQLPPDQDRGDIPHTIPGDCSLGDNIVYGFHPNWRSDPKYTNSYNFKLLSHLNYFSYVVNCETGGVESIGDFHTTDLFETARAENPDIRIDLTLSMGTPTISGKKQHCPSIDFLKNAAAVEKCIATVKDLVKEKELDGICVDFEDINHQGRTQDTLYYSQFLTKLRAGIREVNPDAQLSVAGYASHVDTEQNLMSFRELLDFVVIMGYDYYGSFSKVVGPVAPINQHKNYWLGLDQSVDAYLDGGFSKDRLVLALPYYGNEWFTDGTTSSSTIQKWNSHITFGQLSLREDRFAEHWDSLTGESYYTHSGPGYDSLDWVPNARAMNLKFQFVKEKGLAGTGMWALGYDYPSTELWDLLHANFSECDTSVIPPAGTGSSLGDISAESDPLPATDQEADSTEPASTDKGTGNLTFILVAVLGGILVVVLLVGWLARKKR